MWYVPRASRLCCSCNTLGALLVIQSRHVDKVDSVDAECCCYALLVSCVCLDFVCFSGITGLKIELKTCLRLTCCYCHTGLRSVDLLPPHAHSQVSSYQRLWVATAMQAQKWCTPRGHVYRCCSCINKLMMQLQIA